MSIATMLADPLGIYGIDPAPILPLINLENDEAMLLLAGTFSQGLATPTSDIDILLIYPSGYEIEGFRRSTSLQDHGGRHRLKVSPVRPDDMAFPSDNLLVINRETNDGHKVQTYITSEDYVLELQDLISARNNSFRRRLSGDASAKRREGCMLDRVIGQIILHRLYTGLPLSNGDNIAKLKSRLSLSEIADNVAIRETTQIQNFYSDIEGLLLLPHEPEIDTIIFVLQKIHLHLATVLLAAIGEISPREKLIYRLLKRNREVIGEAVVDDFFASLRSIPESALSKARNISSFVSNIIGRANHMSDLVRDEFQLWTEESTYIPYRPGNA